MGHAAAVKLAIDLMHFPSQVRSVRSAPLPDDVLTLVRIAAGDEEGTREAAEAAGRSREIVCEAARFFVEQIMLYPGAESYRVLGAKPDATYNELRHNMAILLRWLHPDRDRQGERAFFVARVTRAWDDVKTQERRAAYDRLQRIAMAEKSRLRKKGNARAQSSRHGSKRRCHSSRPYREHVVSGRPSATYADEHRGFLRRMLLQLLGRGALWP